MYLRVSFRGFLVIEALLHTVDGHRSEFRLDSMQVRLRSRDTLVIQWRQSCQRDRAPPGVRCMLIFAAPWHLCSFSSWSDCGSESAQNCRRASQSETERLRIELALLSNAIFGLLWCSCDMLSLTLMVDVSVTIAIVLTITTTRPVAVFGSGLPYCRLPSCNSLSGAKPRLVKAPIKQTANRH